MDSRKRKLRVNILVTVIAISMILGLGAQTSLAVKGGHCSSSSSPATTWYLAEGFTGGKFDTYILIANYSVATDSTVRVTFMRQDGTVIQKKYTVTKGSRYSINVGEIPELQNTAFSARVDVIAGYDVVVERSMYFDYEGRTGGHVTMASQQLGSTWHFAEGFTGGDFDTYILLGNPNPTNGASVKVTYMKQDETIVEQTVDVASESRYTIHVDEVAGMSDAAFSTKVEVLSGPNIVAERAMYFSSSGRVGGHVNVGVDGGAIDTKYYFAEGYTGGDFDSYVLLSNPSITTDATVNLTLTKPDGTSKTESYAVPKHSRHTVHVDEISGFSDASFSTEIQSTAGQIIAERAVYFSYDGKNGGHATTATPDALMNTKWYLAEGYTGGDFDTWVLLFNPDATTDAEVQVKFLLPDGTYETVFQTVTKLSRRSIHVDEVSGMDDISFGIKTEVVSGPNVVVERSMYFDYPIE